MSYNPFSQGLWSSDPGYQAYPYNPPPTSYRHPAARPWDRGNAFAHYNGAITSPHLPQTQSTPNSDCQWSPEGHGLLDTTATQASQHHTYGQRVPELPHSTPPPAMFRSGANHNVFQWHQTSSKSIGSYPGPHAYGSSVISSGRVTGGNHVHKSHSESRYSATATSTPISRSTGTSHLSASPSTTSPISTAGPLLVQGGMSSHCDRAVPHCFPIAKSAVQVGWKTFKADTNGHGVPDPLSQGHLAIPSSGYPSSARVSLSRTLEKPPFTPPGRPTPNNTCPFAPSLGHKPTSRPSVSPSQTGGQGSARLDHAVPTDQHNSEPESLMATRNPCSLAESDVSLGIHNDLSLLALPSITCGCDRLMGLGISLRPEADAVSVGIVAIVRKLHATFPGECIISLSRKWCLSTLNVRDIKRAPSGRYDGDHPEWINTAMVAIDSAIREIGVLHGRRRILPRIPKDLKSTFVRGAATSLDAFEAEHRVRGKMRWQMGYLQRECQQVLGSLPKAPCAHRSRPLHLRVNAFRPHPVNPSSESHKAIFLSAPAIPRTFRGSLLPPQSSQDLVSWLSKRSRSSWPPICSAVGRAGQITRFAAPERCFVPTTATARPPGATHTPVRQNSVAGTSRFSLPEKCVPITEPLAPWARHRTATRPWGSALFRSELRKNLEATLITKATLSSILDRSLEILRVSPSNSPKAASTDLVVATPTSLAHQDQRTISTAIAWARDPPPQKIFMPPTTHPTSGLVKVNQGTLGGFASVYIPPWEWGAHLVHP